MSDRGTKSVLQREAIIQLLTDAEVAKVSTAEGAPRLVEGDEYGAPSPTRRGRRS